MIFRMSRTKVKTLDQTYRDFNYYKERGWLESAYYYPTPLGPVKRLAGNLFDLLGRQMVKRE